MFDVFDFGSPEASAVCIQMVDEHDLSAIETEFELIRAFAADNAFRLIAVRVKDWNRDLSSWPAPPVFGKEGFGEGAEKTLQWLTDDILPSFLPLIKGKRKLYLGGYSLAGLFALWAAYQTDLFDGVAAVSPSVWFPGFVDYAAAHPLRTEGVYLSLGDREEKTRNPVMARVGESIRSIHQRIESAGIPCILEWNEGNHFKEPERRTAKGFTWLLNR